MRNSLKINYLYSTVILNTGRYLNFKKTYHLHPAMRILHNAIQKERHVKLSFALCLMFLGIWLPYYYFLKNGFIASVGMVALIIGIRMMFGIIRTPQAVDERLWHLLNKDHGQIVWIYSVTIQTMPFGFHLWDSGTMYFKLLDGDEITVSLPVKKLKMVSKFLNRLIPHASFGYSDERQIQFEKDPKSLLK